ncbi:MAG TPA: Stp1/IreP family PP2C-type Ser/Thr phosphatase [Pirellulales bacterium]|jgi:protein phosphatase|nr:Stp1/IreP family PP2C-type Ser/Thr phosphatase [Pirellulales bacterium]
MSDSATLSEIVVSEPMPALAVRAYGMTDPGRKRPTNEDQFLIAELTKAMHVQQASLPQPKTQFAEERGHLFVVADGMGGREAGEHASALAVETIERFALNTLKWFFFLKGTEEQSILEEFQHALQQADARVCREAAEHPEWSGMGTTVTIAYTFGARLFVVHVGDSRCYLMRGGEMHRITRDHTFVEEMVRLGQLQPSEAANHRLRHVITNAVGGDTKGVKVECHRLELEPGDTVLLCSDGLTEMVADERIQAVLQATADPRAACELLVAEANERGGADNITVVTAHFDALG